MRTIWRKITKQNFGGISNLRSIFFLLASYMVQYIFFALIRSKKYVLCHFDTHIFMHHVVHTYIRFVYGFFFFSILNDFIPTSHAHRTLLHWLRWLCAVKTCFYFVYLFFFLLFSSSVTFWCSTYGAAVAAVAVRFALILF